MNKQLLFFIIIFIFSDYLFAEENYFSIKGIKFRIGRNHNQIQIAKENDEGYYDLELWSRYYTEECKNGCGATMFSDNELKMWFGENKNTSWTFPIQLEFPENVDEWTFSQYYFDFFKTKGLIATEKINAHENKHRNLFLLNDFLTAKEVNDLCPSLKTRQVKKIECILYSENDAEIFFLGKFWGIFIPSNSFRFLTLSGGLGLSYVDAKSKLYICKTADTNYIKNGCDSLNLIEIGEIKNSLGISFGLNFILIKNINSDRSWEFLKFTLLNNTQNIEYENRSKLRYASEIVKGEIFSYTKYF
ncbi:MAG: hypothetical protein QF864_03440 [SAR202 cluster bacterium]|nr:hypothetical protein [SAR202 cluster bacterium]